MVFVLEDNSVVDYLAAGTSGRQLLAVRGRCTTLGSGSVRREDTAYLVSKTAPRCSKPVFIVQASVEPVPVAVTARLDQALDAQPWFDGAVHTRAIAREARKMLDTTTSLWEQGVLPGATLYLLGDTEQTPVWTVRTLTGANVYVPVLRPGIDTVRDMIHRIQDAEGIAADQQRLIWADTRARLDPDPDSVLKDELLQDGALVFLVLRLRGGGGGGAFFSALASLETMLFSADAHTWRRVSAGLNLEGACAQRGCVAFKAHVVVPVGFVSELDIVALKHGKLKGSPIPALLVCPMCHKALQLGSITTCGFTACEWTADGYIAAADHHVHKFGRASKEQYVRAEDGQGEQVEWTSLRITTTRLAADRAADLAVRLE